MPKIITPAMRAHLDAETTRLAAIWRITRKDGAQFFFTDHDRDIEFGGEVYRADAGFARTAIRSDAGFAVDNLDLVGVFAEGGIVEDEVRAGLFDGAGIAISFVNWEDPDGHGQIRLRRGTLGETRLTPQATSPPSCGACRSRSPRTPWNCTVPTAGRTWAIRGAGSPCGRAWSRAAPSMPRASSCAPPTPAAPLPRTSTTGSTSARARAPRTRPSSPPMRSRSGTPPRTAPRCSPRARVSPALPR